MKTTVKRVLWQRTLETAGPLRKPLPKAPARRSISELLTVNVRFDASAVEAQLAQWRRVLERSELGWYDRTEFRRQEDGSMKPFRSHRARRTALFGMDFAQGGVLDQTVCLVGESGPELVVKIPAGALKVGEPADFGDLFLLALPQMVSEMNEVSK